jgi:hypothetical protein
LSAIAPSGDARTDSDACRCDCGSLLARLVAGGVEIKCRRCKRTHVIPLAGGPARVVRHRRPEVPNPEPNPSRPRAGQSGGSCATQSLPSESQ